MCVARASRALDSVGRACGPHRARLLGEEARGRRAKSEKGGNQKRREERSDRDNEWRIRRSERKVAENEGGGRTSVRVRRRGRKRKVLQMQSACRRISRRERIGGPRGTVADCESEWWTSGGGTAPRKGGGGAEWEDWVRGPRSEHQAREWGHVPRSLFLSLAPSPSHDIS